MIRLLYQTGRARGPNQAKDPITHAVFDMVDRSGQTDAHIARRAGVSLTQMSHYRLGHQTPSAAVCAWILEALGATFRVNDDNEVINLPMSLNQLRELRA